MSNYKCCGEKCSWEGGVESNGGERLCLTSYGQGNKPGMALEQRPEGRERVDHKATGESAFQTEDSKNHIPEREACFVYILSLEL